MLRQGEEDSAELWAIARNFAMGAETEKDVLANFRRKSEAAWHGEVSVAIEGIVTCNVDRRGPIEVEGRTGYTSCSQKWSVKFKRAIVVLFAISLTDKFPRGLTDAP